MLIDHIAGIVLVHLPEYTATLATVAGVRVSWYFILRSIGRIAFPIYVFLLVEGFFHTRSRTRYAISLGVFALISEPIWDFARFGVLVNPASQNVFFTLLIGLAALCAVEEFKDAPLTLVLALLCCAILAFTFGADYGPTGLALVLITYGLRSQEALRYAASFCVLEIEPQAILAFPFEALYNGKRGFIGKSALAKYAFYAFYPAHLLVLGLVCVWLGIY